MKKEKLKLNKPSNPTETTPLIDPLDIVNLEEGPSDKKESRCASCGTACCSCLSVIARPAWNFTKTAGYHALDFARINLVTQALLSRWLYQFFIELERNEWGIPSPIKLTWLNWPITGGAFTAAVIVKIINLRKQDKQGNYLSAQDYLFAGFSSSILYFALDAILDAKVMAENMSAPWFIATTIGVPVLAFFAAATIIPDSSNQIHIKLDSDKFPVYPNASRKEKSLNMISGLAYASAITMLLWCINRELRKETVPLETWQLVVAGAYLIPAAAAGWLLTQYPKVFHGFIAASKGIRDAALSYAGLSGLGYLTLIVIHDCTKGPCWGDDGTEESYLTSLFIPIALSIGVFSAATTLFRYKEKHAGNEKLIKGVTYGAKRLKDGAVYLKDSASNTARSAKNRVSNAAQSVKVKLTNCYAFFCQRHDEQQQNENSAPINASLYKSDSNGNKFESPDSSSQLPDFNK